MQVKLVRSRLKTNKWLLMSYLRTKKSFKVHNIHEKLVLLMTNRMKRNCQLRFIINYIVTKKSFISRAELILPNIIQVK